MTESLRIQHPESDVTQLGTKHFYQNIIFQG